MSPGGSRMAVWLHEYEGAVCPRTGERISGREACKVGGKDCEHLSRRAGGWLRTVQCKYKGA